MSTVDVINIAADRQKFMTLNGELSWQRLRRSAVPGIWLCPPKFKWFTWLNHALSGMPYHPRASNCYRQSTYQMANLKSLSTHYEDMKDGTKCRKWGGLR